jgi:hypothetical protein
METHFNKVRNYILELEFDVTHENEEEGIIVIKKEGTGIQNLVIGCADPILIMEQFLFAINNVEVGTLSALLKKNRDIVHGAFVLDETGSKVIFRDTLQLENLDLNELEGSINSLSLLLAEYSDQLIKFSKN